MTARNKIGNQLTKKSHKELKENTSNIMPGPLKKKSGSFYGLDDELFKELEAWSEESEDIGNCAHDDDETEEEMEQSAAASAGPSTLKRKYMDASGG